MPKVAAIDKKTENHHASGHEYTMANSVVPARGLGWKPAGWLGWHCQQPGARRSYACNHHAIVVPWRPIIVVSVSSAALANAA